MEVLESKYLEITRTKEELARHRELQQRNRARWQGGGFGVKGAIKGAATASMLNFGSDILHSLGDSTNSSFDDSKISSMKKSLLRDYKNNGKLELGLRQCILGSLNSFIDELVINNKMSYPKLNKDEATALYNNTISYESSSEILLKNIIECINKYPYEVKFYEPLYAIDSKDENLLNLVSFFGLENSECSNYKKKYDEIDLQKRTFNGTTYTTIEERNFAKNDFISYSLKISEAIENSIQYYKIDLTKFDKQDYLNAKKIIQAIYENFNADILKDTLLTDNNLNAKAKSIENIRDFVINYEKVENNANKFEEIKANNFELKPEDYLSEDDLSNRALKIISVISFVLTIASYVFMGSGIFKIIVVGFFILFTLGGILQIKENEYKKALKLEELKKDYAQYKE